MRCVKNCPGNAILNQKIVNVDNIEGIDHIKTCKDTMKCFEQFLLKYGCSICMKICPFSAKNNNYYMLKDKFAKKLNP